MQRKSETGDKDAERGLAECRKRLLDAQARLPDWSLDSDGFEALAGGLAQTYKRARKAADEAFVSPRPEAIHELRKRLKYHWYHTRLLANIWPDLLDVHASLAKKLTELLGIHHDLSVFVEHLEVDPSAYGSPGDVETALGLAQSYSAKLEHRTAPMVRRLVAQEPGELIHEWRALWSAWRDVG